MVTIIDVAKFAGVSPMSVSRVLNNVPGKVSEEKRKRILNAIEKLHYYPNSMGRGLAGARLNIAGIVSPCMEGYGVLGLSYFRRIVRGIELGCMESGLDYLVNTVQPGKEFDYLDLYYRRLVDGLILIDPEQDHPQVMKLLQDKIPAVMIADRHECARAWIDTDNLKVTADAVEYLKSKGHKNIGFVSGRAKHKNGEDRNQGFLNGMKAAGLSINQDWIFPGNFSEDDGRKAAEALTELRNRPTAVICANDLSAIGLIRGLTARGINIPGEISVTGIDGIDEGSSIHPALTTWEQPLEEMGLWAVRSLIELLDESKNEPLRKICPMKLVEKSSVKQI